MAFCEDVQMEMTLLLSSGFVIFATVFFSLILKSHERMKWFINLA